MLLIGWLLGWLVGWWWTYLGGLLLSVDPCGAEAATAAGLLEPLAVLAAPLGGSSWKWRSANISHFLLDIPDPSHLLLVSSVCSDDCTASVLLQ